MNGRGSFLGSIPTVTKNLLIINVLMLIATSVFRTKGIDLNEWIGLHYWEGSKFNVAQLITYNSAMKRMSSVLPYVPLASIRNW